MLKDISPQRSNFDVFLWNYDSYYDQPHLTVESNGLINKKTYLSLVSFVSQERIPLFNSVTIVFLPSGLNHMSVIHLDICFSLSYES